MDTGSGSLLEKIDKGVGTLLDWQEGADKRLKKLEAGAAELKTRVGAAEGSRKKSDEFAADLERRYEKARWDGTDRGGAGEPLRGVTPDGTEVRILRPQERLADLADAGLSTEQLGHLFRGWVTGNWSAVDSELRQMSGASAIDGGFAISAARVVDLARNLARVIQAGALTISMDTRDVTIAKVAGDPVPAWRGENVALPKSSPTFSAVKLQARTLGLISLGSIEVFEDAANLGALIEQVVAQVLALELDRVALLGLGSQEEPLGVELTDGVQTITSVGTPSDYSKFSDAIFKVAEKNGEASAIIVAPRTLNTLDKLEDSTGQPLQPPPSWGTLRKLMSNQVPVNRGGGANESLAFVGGFENLWIGVRREIMIEASRQAGDSTGSAFTNLQVWVRAFLRADVVCVRPEQFVVMSGILS